MSLLSKLTGHDASRRRTQTRQKAESAAAGGNEGTRMVAALPAEQARGAGFDANAAADRTSFLDLISGGQNALETSTRAAVQSAMPSFQGSLQKLRESNQRRGLEGGETPTSYEGDLFSAFQNNIANSVGSQAMSLYGTQLGARQGLLGLDTAGGENSRNRYLDLLSGQLDRKTAKQNASKAAVSNNIAGIGQMLAAIAAMSSGGGGGN